MPGAFHLTKTENRYLNRASSSKGPTWTQELILRPVWSWSSLMSCNTWKAFLVTKRLFGPVFSRYFTKASIFYESLLFDWTLCDSDTKRQKLRCDQKTKLKKVIFCTFCFNFLICSAHVLWLTSRHMLIQYSIKCIELGGLLVDLKWSLIC